MLHEALIKLLAHPPSPERAAQREDILFQSITSNGSLPFSRSVVQQLTASAEAASGSRTSTGARVTLNDLVNHVLCDPVLAMRLLAQVNRAFYQRGTAVTSISETVKLLGTRRLLTIVAEAGTATDLTALMKRNLAYVCALQEHSVAAQFAKELFAALPEDAAALISLDAIQVVVSLLAAPLLALAWNEPGVYAWMMLASSSAELQLGASTTATLDRRSLSPPVEKIFGFTKPALTLGLVRNLRLPEEFQRILGMCSVQAIRVTAGSHTPEGRITKLIAANSFFSSELAHEFLRFSGRQPFEGLIRETQQRLDLPGGTISPLLQKIQPECQAFQQSAGLPDLPLPDAGLFSRTAEGAAAVIELPVKTVSSAVVGAFIEELRRHMPALKADRGTKVGAPPELALTVWLTLQALVRVLQFERAALLGVDLSTGELKAVVSFGVPHERLQKYRQSLQVEAKGDGPEIKAVLARKSVFKGIPISPDGAQACAFPIIQHELVQGVFYAERIGGLRSAPLPPDMQMLVVAVAECWQDL